MDRESLFDRFAGHEQVVLANDPETGLRALIGLHSTALGPGLGGTRFHVYPDDGAALDDVLRLSQAMSYKNALAGLPHGGGKAVIIGDPRRDKTEALLEAYGRAVESLGGRYITACDVGTYVQDMDVIARVTSHVTGRSEAGGGSGDSSVLTALGVFAGMRACARYRWGTDDLSGRRIGIAGVGKVGHRLVRHLREAGASVVIFDVDPDAIRRVVDADRDVEVADSQDDLIRWPGLDIFSPNALGGVLNEGTVAALTASVVCGGANNQLAHARVAHLLADRDITYAPDYLVNAGGVIQVADELHGFDLQRATERTLKIFDTTLEVLELAAAKGLPPAQAADRLAEARIAAALADGGP
ncbi:MAG TPA: Glu/Leu/Phe/Val dehydrogenase dimerization domain-containing protein [Actinomycetes bacterium]|nr:Glu/Leu/Phe/Val dehydrogenase dimerization domain-containing protein [Actinomycetes bacterium]